MQSVEASDLSSLAGAGAGKHSSVLKKDFSFLWASNLTLVCLQHRWSQKRSSLLVGVLTCSSKSAPLLCISLELLLLPWLWESSVYFCWSYRAGQRTFKGFVFFLKQELSVGIVSFFLIFNMEVYIVVRGSGSYMSLTHHMRIIMVVCM